METAAGTPEQASDHGAGKALQAIQLWVGGGLIALLLWHLSSVPFQTGFVSLNDTEARSLVLATVLFLALLVVRPVFRGAVVFNALLAFAVGGSAAYLWLDYDGLASRIAAPTTMDLAVGAVGLVGLLVAVWRLFGPPLALLGAAVLLASLDATGLPELLGLRGASPVKLVSHHWIATEGVFGIPLGTFLDWKTILPALLVAMACRGSVLRAVDWLTRRPLAWLDRCPVSSVRSAGPGNLIAVALVFLWPAYSAGAIVEQILIGTDVYAVMFLAGPFVAPLLAASAAMTARSAWPPGEGSPRWATCVWIWLLLVAALALLPPFPLILLGVLGIAWHRTGRDVGERRDFLGSVLRLTLVVSVGFLLFIVGLLVVAMLVFGLGRVIVPNLFGLPFMGGLILAVCVLVAWVAYAETWSRDADWQLLWMWRHLLPVAVAILFWAPITNLMVAHNSGGDWMYPPDLRILALVPALINLIAEGYFRRRAVLRQGGPAPVAETWRPLLDSLEGLVRALIYAATAFAFIGMLVGTITLTGMGIAFSDVESAAWFDTILARGALFLLLLVIGALGIALRPRRRLAAGPS